MSETSRKPYPRSKYPLEDQNKQIEIWSKAAIGWYLWNSIFNARLQVGSFLVFIIMASCIINKYGALIVILIVMGGGEGLMYYQ